MKFSVLISVCGKDNPDFFLIALQSIYEMQTRKPDEIVIVFDGPLSDGLYKAVKKFLSDKTDIVKTVELKKNSGLGNALRAGCKECTGDYIFRMDSDDISDRKRFEKQVKYIEENPQIDCVGSYISEFKSSTCEKMRVRTVPVTHDGIVKLSKHRNPMNHVSVCIKKSALLGCGGYEKILLLEDYYLWLKMIKCGYRLANIPESMVNVRLGNNFSSKRGAKARITGWKQLQKYMLDNNMIGRIDSVINMIYIRTFVNMPNPLRGFAYNFILRK